MVLEHFVIGLSRTDASSFSHCNTLQQLPLQSQLLTTVSLLITAQCTCTLILHSCQSIPGKIQPSVFALPFAGNVCVCWVVVNESFGGGADIGRRSTTPRSSSSPSADMKPPACITCTGWDIERCHFYCHAMLYNNTSFFQLTISRHKATCMHYMHRVRHRKVPHLLPRYAMQVRPMLSSGVCVCLSHSYIVSKPMDISSKFYHLWVAKPF